MLARALMLGIRGYRALPRGMPSCRFQPTCSQYALDAIASHGAARGSALAVRRIARCHPWGGHGYDPVPMARERPPR